MSRGEFKPIRPNLSDTETEREDETDKEQEIENEMGDIPYELLVKADRKTNKIEKKNGKKPKLSMKRRDRYKEENKEAPKERSAKKPPTIDKRIFEKKINRSVDPRFLGEPMDDFQKMKFYENYDFLVDMKHKENKDFAKDLRKLKKKKQKDEGAIETLHQSIGSNKNTISSFRKDREMVKIREELRQENREQGQHMKHSEFKRALQSKISDIKAQKFANQRRKNPKPRNDRNGGSDRRDRRTNAAWREAMGLRA